MSVVVSVLSCLSFKNIFRRFGLSKSNLREFYECGFKPIIQKPITFSIQFLSICIFFFIYDIELVFSFPLVSTFGNHALIELLLFVFLYGSFVVSLWYDYDQSITEWFM